MTRFISKVETGIDVPYTVTMPTPNPQFSYLLPNSPSQLYSLNIAVDSTFLSYYSYKIIITTIIQDSNNFTMFPSGQTSYEFVPASLSNGIPLASGTKIIIYAYNSNGATSDGHFSVSILASTED